MPKSFSTKEASNLLKANSELRKALRENSFQSCSIVTGPEGGFTEEEVRAAQAAGMRICTLGPRILRCETAPLCALTAILYEAGEFDYGKAESHT